MNWFKKLKVPEDIGLSGAIDLDFDKAKWSFKYEIGHLLSEAVLPMSAKFADVKYSRLNPRKSALTLGRSARISEVYFGGPEIPDGRSPHLEGWEGAHCYLDIRVENTKTIEESFKIGQGYRRANDEEVHIILILSENEIRKLLMLAPYEFAQLPIARLQVDRVSRDPDTESGVTFAVVSASF